MSAQNDFTSFVCAMPPDVLADTMLDRLSWSNGSSSKV